MGPRWVRRLETSSGRRLTTCALVGLIVGLALGFAGAAPVAPLIGWDAASGLFTVWVLVLITTADQQRTAALLPTSS